MKTIIIAAVLAAAPTIGHATPAVPPASALANCASSVATLGTTCITKPVRVCHGHPGGYGQRCRTEFRQFCIPSPSTTGSGVNWNRVGR